MQFKGAKQRTDGWYELGLFVAWHIALFMRVPKTKALPDLAPLLKKMRDASGTTAGTTPAPVRQTWQEQKGIMAAIRALAVTAPTAIPKARTDPPKGSRKKKR